MTKELISEYTCKPFTLWNVPKAYSVECIRFFFQMYVCMYVHRYICMQEYVFYLRCNYVHVRVKERRGVERVCVCVCLSSSYPISIIRALALWRHLTLVTVSSSSSLNFLPLLGYGFCHFLSHLVSIGYLSFFIP